MPDLTIASAIPRTSSSLTLQANLFQEFHPMGGVSARPLETADSWANAVPVTENAREERMMDKIADLFMAVSTATHFYQIRRTYEKRQTAELSASARFAGRRAACDRSHGICFARCITILCSLNRGAQMRVASS